MGVGAFSMFRIVWRLVHSAVGLAFGDIRLLVVSSMWVSSFVVWWL